MNTTISVITATYRRPDLLARAAQSVLGQQVDAVLEYIVVNDAGEPLPHAPWMDDPRVHVLNTQHVERSVARNTGAAQSTGVWLHFLDDDDYLLPGALAALLRAAQTGPAAIVYGGYEIHNVADNVVHTVHPALNKDAFPAFLADEMLPMGASWFARAAFFAVGGFDPCLVQAEDVDLHRRLAFYGSTTSTEAMIAALRVNHLQTSLTDAQTNHALWLSGLEKCLNMPGYRGASAPGTDFSLLARALCA